MTEQATDFTVIPRFRSTSRLSSVCLRSTAVPQSSKIRSARVLFIGLEMVV